MDAGKREKLMQIAVTRLLTGGLLQGVTKTGEGQYISRCIFHSPDNNPSMSLNAVKGVVHCFSCGEDADVLEAYQVATGKTFAEAAAELEAAAGITAEALVADTKTRPPRRVATFTYRDEDGEKRYEKERWEPGRNGRTKEFFFYHREAVIDDSSKSKRVKGRGGEKVLYNLDKLASSGSGVATYFTEGEKKADLLISWGLTATCTDSGGATTTWEESYNTHLAGRHVILVPDHDKTGEKYAGTIAAALAKVAGRITVLRLSGLSEAEDILDWHGRKDPATGATNDCTRFMELAACAPDWEDAATAVTETAKKEAPPPPDVVKKRKEETEEHREPRNAEKLIALYWDKPMYRDTTGAGYIDIDGELFPLETRCVRLKELMAYTAFKTTGKTAGDSATNPTISTLSHRARMEGETLELFSRIGELNGDFWYDLGNNRAVRITPEGWEIVPRPLWFRSFSHHIPQPDPERGGDVHRFFDFVNNKEESRLLALCSLGALFIPRITRPLLHFIGCQGSGKTFSARLWKRLYDPSTVELSSVPRKEEDLDLLLFRNALLTLDNLSYLPPATADRLCAFISGAAIERRALYSDLDTTILQSNCVVAITSITDLHGRPDLLERTVKIEHDRITSDYRRTERELLAEFDAALPGILGGMFDIISKAMSIHPTVKLGDIPRMADAAGWMYAIAEAIGPGRGRELMQHLSENSASQSRNLLDGDSLFAAIIAYMESGRPLAGSFGECQSYLMESAKPDKEDKTFPRNATGFRSHLSRLQVPLEHLGIGYSIDTKRTAHRRSWVEFHRIEVKPDQTPPEEIMFTDDELTGADL